jgi:uncharacterized protein YbjT (DUF2867 family)
MRIAVAGATGHVGRPLVALAEAEGHEVVPLSRSTGVDLVEIEAGRLEEVLTGVEAVVDVAQAPTTEPQPSQEFFETVAAKLGAAGHAVGVRRTVLLSIVGIDRSPDYGYYVAKVAQEAAVRAAAPGPLVLRATQFHDFAGQVLGWSRDGDRVHAIDFPTQPVDTAEVARVLLDLATGALDHDVQVAGPRVESLLAQVRTLAEREGLTVVTADAPESLAGGAALPVEGEETLIRGQDWSSWLARQG